MLRNPFPIPWLDNPGHGCACCASKGEGAEALLDRALKAALQTLDPKINVPYATKTGFDEGEAALAGLVASAAADLYPDLIAIYAPIMIEGANWNEAQIEEAHAKADALWRSIAVTLEPQVREIIANILYAAIDEVDGQRLKDAAPLRGITLSRQKVTSAREVENVLSAMTRSFMAYTEDWFTSHIVPQINGLVMSVLDATGSLAMPNFAPVLDLIKTRLSSTSYFEIVAAATASRVYHYGFLKTAHAAGYKEYLFIGVRDERQSEICRYLHGSRWLIRNALPQVEAASVAESTDDIKAAHPWFARTPDDFIGDDAAKYYTERTPPWPPLHGRCRSTLQVFNKAAPA